MKRVVIDARESGTSTGRYIDKLIEYLHKLNPDDIEIQLLAKSHRTGFLQGIAPSFKVIETSFNEFTFGEQLGFKKQIESLKPDLVHFGMVQQPIFYKGRVVTTMHDLTTVRFKNPSKNAVLFTIKQQVYKWVNKKAAKKSMTVFTPTQFVKDDVVKYTGISSEKVLVTLESADKISDQPETVPELQGKQFIMYVGRPTPHKNLGRLIDAFSIMQQSSPELYLVLAGKKDALYDQHAIYVNEKGIKNVIFTGFISDGQLRWLYEHTACYVFPSLSEGFGLPGLEAMIHGAPVASSNYSCLPEVYGDAAAYFDPTSAQGIGETVNKVITDKNYAENLKQLGLKQMQKYSWQRMAEQTLEAYRKALS